VRINILSSAGKAPFVAIGKINIFTIKTKVPQVAEGGKWGATLDFPIVPVAAWVDPLSNNVVTLSADGHISFGYQLDDPKTHVATWLRNDPNDPTGRNIVHDVLTFHHEMFCPGMSFDEKGRMIISGGSSNRETTIWDPNASDKRKQWIRSDQSKLKVPRGYQGQTFVSDGKTFVVGGSWPDGTNNNPAEKGCEVFDSTSSTWAILSQCKAEDVAMTEMEKVEENDFHVWMFAWKKGSIFQAGPSKNMHWINPAGSGKHITPAGPRANDQDAVCGVTSMFDAERGLILTAGGAPNYHYWTGKKRERTAESELRTSRQIQVQHKTAYKEPGRKRLCNEQCIHHQSYRRIQILGASQNYEADGSKAHFCECRDSSHRADVCCWWPITGRTVL
jgi:galactose oxidase